MMNVPVLPPLPLSGESEEDQETESLETEATASPLPAADPVATTTNTRKQKLLTALGARSKKMAPDSFTETVTRTYTFPSRDFRETQRLQAEAQAKKTRDRQIRDTNIIDYRQLAGVRPGEPLPSDSWRDANVPLPQISPMLDQNIHNLDYHPDANAATDSDTNPRTSSPIGDNNIQLEELTDEATGNTNAEKKADNNQQKRPEIKQETRTPKRKPTTVVTVR